MQYRVTNLQSTPLIVVGYHFQGAEVRIIEEAALDTALWWYSVGSGRLLEIEPIDAEVESEVEPEDTSGLKDEKSETAGKEGSTDDDDDDDEGSDDKGSEKSTTSTDGGENE